MSSQSRAVFKVLNISWTCVRHDLRAYFKRYGKVYRVGIPMDRMTGFNKKIALVEIEGADGFAEKILQDSHIIDDQEVTVKLDSKTEFSARERRDKSTGQPPE